MERGNPKAPMASRQLERGAEEPQMAQREQHNPRRQRAPQLEGGVEESQMEPQAEERIAGEWPGIEELDEDEFSTEELEGDEFLTKDELSAEDLDEEEFSDEELSRMNFTSVWRGPLGSYRNPMSAKAKEKALETLDEQIGQDVSGI